ncbi:MAG: response regulator transcription factor [Acidimicrobiia bacterium]|nr:response regulator transcription factor [Acidimicrobiia bacterium]
MTQRSSVALVIDDIPMFRLGVMALLEPIGVDVVAETGSPRDLLEAVHLHEVDLVVIGSVGQTPVTDLVGKLRDADDPPAVVVLLPRSHAGELTWLLNQEVGGLLVRSADGDEIARSVERVLAGERVVAPALLSTVVGELDVPGEGEAAEEGPLTAREREVLSRLGKGSSNREIAAELMVTVATVKTHLAHIYEKLGAKNRNEALREAVARGLLA